MRRKDDRLDDPAEPVDDACEPFRLHVRLAVDRRDHVRRRFDLEPLEDARAPACVRRELKARVRHHIADHLDPAADAFAAQRRRRPLVRRKQEVGHAVDGDPVALLRHREVAAPESRLDVRNRHSRGDRRFRPGQGRVRVAVHERPLRPLALERSGDPGPHRVGVGRVEVEPVRRLRQRELLEEHVGELGIPVLAGVDDHLVDLRGTQGNGYRARLDELRAVAHDRENPHRVRLQWPPLWAVSSIGRAGDS